MSMLDCIVILSYKTPSQPTSKEQILRCVNSGNNRNSIPIVCCFYMVRSIFEKSNILMNDHSDEKPCTVPRLFNIIY